MKRKIRRIAPAGSSEYPSVEEFKEALVARLLVFAVQNGETADRVTLPRQVIEHYGPKAIRAISISLEIPIMDENDQPV